MLNYSHGIITQMQFYDNTKDKRVELQDLKQRLIDGMDQRWQNKNVLMQYICSIFSPIRHDECMY